MKILHILHGRKAHAGIEAIGIDAILALQERENVKQFVVCRPHESFFVPLSQAKIPIATVNFNKWNKWLMKRWIPRQVYSKIKAYAPDVINCWGKREPKFLPPNSGVPALQWDAYVPNLDGDCDYYSCTSHSQYEKVIAQIGRPDLVFMSHAFGALPQDTALSREEFGIPNDKPVILFLGRMVEDKGVDILLRACVDLDAFFLLAGEGPELENYRQLAKDLGLESRVCFAGWRKDRSALLEIADILAVPSRHESTPAVMSQAWYKGVPLVASNIEGLREHIEHGINGMLSDIEDVEGLANNLRAVLEDDTLRSRLIAGGTYTYETQFSKEVVISNLLKTYEEIIRRGPVL